MTARRLRQLWYVPLLGTAMALMLLRVLLMAKLLDVSGFAEFSAALLVSSSFCMLACLGLHSLLQRDWPGLIVGGRERRAVVLMSQAILVAIGLAFLGGLAACAGWSGGTMSPRVAGIGVLHGLAQQIFLLVTVESRSRGDPLRFAWQMMVRAGAVIGCSAAAALLSGSATAAVLVDAAVSMMIAAFLVKNIHRRAAITAVAAYRAAWTGMRRVPWRSARALLLVSLATFVVQYTDRWIAARWLDTPRFAEYAFAWIVLMIAQSVQLMINSSIYPLIARRFASHGALVSYAIARRVSIAALMAGVLLGPAIWWAANRIIVDSFPTYLGAAPLIALFVAIAVLRVSDFWTTFLVIAGHEVRLIRINLLTGAAATLVWLAFIQPWQGTPPSLLEMGAFPALLATIYWVTVAYASWRGVRVRPITSGRKT